MKTGGTPLSAYSLALDYNVKGWFFNLTGNYYDRVYIDFSSYRRLGSVLDKNGAGVDANGNPVLHVPGQEKLDGGFMLDASIACLRRPPCIFSGISTVPVVSGYCPCR